MTVYIGLALFLLMGITLGLIGAGGSILTIPIIVYLFDVPPLRATTYSLFIVGITSLVGSLRYRHLINRSKGLYFALPSLWAVFLARYFLLPALPDAMLGIKRDSLLMAMLAIVMLMAGILMMRNGIDGRKNPRHIVHPVKVIFGAFFCGLLMGILGVGGGFLIIPAIVLWLGVAMKEAVATSLFIITINSAVGFFAAQTSLSWQDYQYLFVLAALSVGGLLIGISLNEKLDGKQLRRCFAWLVTLLAICIAITEMVR